MSGERQAFISALKKKAETERKIVALLDDNARQIKGMSGVCRQCFINYLKKLDPKHPVNPKKYEYLFPDVCRSFPRGCSVRLKHGEVPRPGMTHRYVSISRSLTPAQESPRCIYHALYEKEHTTDFFWSRLLSMKQMTWQYPPRKISINFRRYSSRSKAEKKRCVPVDKNFDAKWASFKFCPKIGEYEKALTRNLRKHIKLYDSILPFSGSGVEGEIRDSWWAWFSKYNLHVYDAAYIFSDPGISPQFVQVYTPQQTRKFFEKTRTLSKIFKSSGVIPHRNQNYDKAYLKKHFLKLRDRNQIHDKLKPISSQEQCLWLQRPLVKSVWKVWGVIPKDNSLNKLNEKKFLEKYQSDDKSNFRHALRSFFTASYPSPEVYGGYGYDYHEYQDIRYAALFRRGKSRKLTFLKGKIREYYDTLLEFEKAFLTRNLLGKPFIIHPLYNVYLYVDHYEREWKKKNKNNKEKIDQYAKRLDSRWQNEIIRTVDNAMQTQEELGVWLNRNESHADGILSMKTAEEALKYIQKKAQDRAVNQKHSLAKCKFLKHIKEEYFKEYLKKPSKDNAGKAIEELAGKTEYPLLHPKNIILEMWVPEGFRKACKERYGEDMPEWFFPVWKYIFSKTIFDTSFLIGRAPAKKKFFKRILFWRKYSNDFTTPGHNWSDALHWAGGLKYSYLDSRAVQDLFIGYELWHLEGWDVFGIDAINDLIAEEQGRLLGVELRKASLKSAGEFDTCFAASFYQARAWVGALLKLREKELIKLILQEKSPMSEFWWGGEEALKVFPPWDNDGITGALKKNDRIDLTGKIELLIQIYTLIYEVDEWKRIHKRKMPLTRITTDVVMGRYNHQFRKASKEADDKWTWKIIK